MLDFITLACPYCGESFDTAVDCSAGSQRYIEDCAICCRPIEVSILVSEAGEFLDVQTSTDNE